VELKLVHTLFSKTSPHRDKNHPRIMNDEYLRACTNDGDGPCSKRQIERS
jgi:hypothetical protein